MQTYKNVDEYINSFSGETRKKLESLRQAIHSVVPEAKEKIAYGIPTFTHHGNLVHFAGYKTHIGFYPGSTPIKQFERELAGFKTSKGTIQFPLDKPLPIELIRKIVLACAERNEQRKSSD